jgi:hypothetical protein
MSPELTALSYKVVVSLAVGVIMYIALWPFKKVRKEWTEFKDEQLAIHSELVRQRENCLNTLQLQGDTQIVLLRNMNNTLDGIRLDLAQQAGFLGASPVRRRPSKK